jgi:Outer membrane protein beta-barrel domain
MRRLSLITTILIIVFCQGVRAQNFKAELFGGVVGSQVSGDELSGFNKGGFALGAGVRLSIDEKSSIGFRLGYIQKGSRMPSGEDAGYPSFYLLRLHYLEMPILYRYRIGKKLYFEAGPSLGYLFSAHEEDQFGEMPYMKPFLKFDLSANGILGYPLGKNWDFQLGMIQSVLPIREHGSGTTYRLNKGQYNTVITFEFLKTFGSK